MKPQLQRNSVYTQGVYKPKNPKKVINTSEPIVYRSSLELKFMRWCDFNDNVVKWGSECVVVPYSCPFSGKQRRYFVDNIILLKTKKGIVKYLVEIKPSSALVKPENKKYKRKKTLLYEQTTYIQNNAKWEAAKKFALQRNAEFVVITEKELNN